MEYIHNVVRGSSQSQKVWIISQEKKVEDKMY